MIEPYQWLVEHAAEYGYKLEHCGPASVDLCLHPRVMTYRDGMRRESPRDPDFGIRMRPGGFYLCSTCEYIVMPETHCGFINMRSSWARRGLGHKMAGFIDPGFVGQITLELETTVLVDVPVGERIVQLVYMRLNEPTEKPYTGRYRGQTGPTEAYDAR